MLTTWQPASCSKSCYLHHHALATSFTVQYKGGMIQGSRNRIAIQADQIFTDMHYIAIRESHCSLVLIQFMQHFAACSLQLHFLQKWSNQSTYSRAIFKCCSMPNLIEIHHSCNIIFASKCVCEIIYAKLCKKYHKIRQLQPPSRQFKVKYILFKPLPIHQRRSHPAAPAARLKHRAGNL